MLDPCGRHVARMPPYPISLSVSRWTNLCAVNRPVLVRRYARHDVTYMRVTYLRCKSFRASLRYTTRYRRVLRGRPAENYRPVSRRSIHCCRDPPPPAKAATLAEDLLEMASCLPDSTSARVGRGLGYGKGGWASSSVPGFLLGVDVHGTYIRLAGI